jgi:uncharacterized delta-60 repeat protein
MNLRFIFGVSLLLISASHVGAQTADSFNPSPDSVVDTVAVQPDARILIGGSFGSAGGAFRQFIARLNADGSLDPLFNPGTDATVNSIGVQPDGKIVVAGNFSSIAGQPRTNLARLNSDGTPDATFNSSARGAIRALALQSDGRMLVGGMFTNLAGQVRSYIGRLNVDGSLDPNFNASADGPVLSLLLQQDGKILVGGAFTNLDGVNISRLGRLKPDGSLDAAFNPAPDGSIVSMALQADNMILVGGSFTNIGGAVRIRIARLASDGTADPTFHPGASNSVSSISVQANGKILVCGSFNNIAGVPVSSFARLNANGTADFSFLPAIATSAQMLLSQADGKVLVAGVVLTNLAGSARRYIGRLTNNEPTTESLTFTASSVTWLRGGSAPEVWRTTFDFSTDGTNWTNLGDGSRVAGGWQLSGVSIPSNCSLRARGFFSAIGNLSTSFSVLQSFAGSPFIKSQPLSQASVAGSNVTFTVAAGGTSALFYRWQKDGTNLNNGGKISGATNLSLLLTGVVNSNGGAYSVIITNSYGAVTSAVATLSIVNSATNEAFNPSLGQVYSTAIQRDGKAIIGGTFNKSLNGQSYSGIARVNSDGSLETSFHPSAPGTYSVMVQNDGRILVGGGFSSLAGQVHPGLGRLNADGSLDASFTATVDGTVYSTLAQPDGKILVAGTFTRLGMNDSFDLGRINADGTVDTDFLGSASNTVYCMALQTNGQIIVGGTFSNLDGVPCANLGRLNPDGTLDSGFNPSPNGTVNCVAMQPDGKVIVGGTFLRMGAQWRPYLVRLNFDGSLDPSFNPDPYTSVYSVVVESDGKILIGGSFTIANGLARNYFARLNRDGTVDSTFFGGANGTVYSIALQPDGKILVGGSFTSLSDSKLTSGRFGIGRFSNTEIPTENFVLNGSNMTWLRNGPGPEFAWTALEASADATNWSRIGAGIRISEGWQLSGASGATNFIRGLGYVTGGGYDGSGWLMQVFAGKPLYLTQPTNLTCNAGSTAQFEAQAGGYLPIFYQWMKDGLAITNVASAQSPTLVLTNLKGADAGYYSVVANNSYGIGTSSAAALSVIDPATNYSSTVIGKDAGESVTLSANAVGTPPFYYQWRKAGIPLEGQTNSTLVLTNLGAADRALFTVVVSNSFGIQTNVIAFLDINLASVDYSFSPGTDDYNIRALALQTDGKIIVGGYFSTLAGQSQSGVGRLNFDGTLDNTINLGDANNGGGTAAICVQPDGKILLGGSFTNLSAQPRYHIGRFNANGTLDPAIFPAVELPNGLVVQPDSNILINATGGQTVANLERTDSAGNFDTNFIPGITDTSGTVVIQPDGKYVVGGGLVQRLYPDGSKDTNFLVVPDSVVRCLAVQPDGKILIGGTFTHLNGVACKYLGRVNSDGTVDTNFNSVVGDWVYCMALQADGKVIIGGLFTSVSGQGQAGVARLNSDGSLDPVFRPALLGTAGIPFVSAIAIQTNGEVIIGGYFSYVGLQSYLQDIAFDHLARLNSTDPATDSLTADSYQITWLRGGTSPEVWQTTFEMTTNGLDWIFLGNGTRIQNGWQKTSVQLPRNATIRARGYVHSSGFLGATAWCVEKQFTLDPRSAPRILWDDPNFGRRTNLFGFDVSALIGQTLIVESSTDLMKWTPIYTNAVTSSPFYYYDPKLMNMANRFYRVNLP